MPNTGLSEIYFIAVMMVLIFGFSIAAVFIFFRTYNREKREREENIRAKKASAAENRAG
jgi:cbb3-type cytochrome oxidase subunit 3